MYLVCFHLYWFESYQDVYQIFISLRRVFDLHTYKLLRDTCGEVAVHVGTATAVNNFSVSDIAMPGKRYHYCILSKGTAIQRGFFSHNKP